MKSLSEEAERMAFSWIRTEVKFYIFNFKNKVIGILITKVWLAGIFSTQFTLKVFNFNYDIF